MFETNHVAKNGSIEKGFIHYVVWSEVLICPNCTNELIFWEQAIDKQEGTVKAEFICPSCGKQLKKHNCERATVTQFDRESSSFFSEVRRVPVLINYSIGNRRYDKEPDAEDLATIRKIDELKIDFFYPDNQLILGDEIGRLESMGITSVAQLLSKRNNIVLGDFLRLTETTTHGRLCLFILTASLTNLTWMYRWRANKKGGTISGTYYIGSTPQENNGLIQLERKLSDIEKALTRRSRAVITTQSSSSLPMGDGCVDYIFVDPPFGSNLMYSELNFVWESWLKVFTNSISEAIVNKSQTKGLPEYHSLIHQCFSEFHRILKPGCWMTVVFSNSQASVWNTIQEALQRAGFVIANVSALDKKQGSFKAVTTTTAVKQDLVISAYKPSTSMIEEIRIKENTAESAWIFVRSHLEKLPVFVGTKGEAELIVERTPRVLFDRMVAYHVQNGYSVPISSAEFQEGVAQRFPMRDGMAFLETQVIEYDKKRLLAKEFVQTTLFVSDENSAIEWLRQQLMQKPQTRQDLHPNFMKELQHISKHELLPELDVLLEQNFLMYDGTGPVPSQIHAYLSTDFKDLRNLEKDDPKLQAKAKNRWYVPDPNKQADLEKLRERSLLREFNSYIEELGKSKKKLRQFRTEAIRAGFKTAWGNQDYQTIVDVGQRLPEKVLQEDSTMLMYYDNAQVRLGM